MNSPLESRWNPLKICNTYLPSYVTAIVWQSGPTFSNFLMIFHVFISNTTTELPAGFGYRTDTNFLLRSIEKQRWNGLGYWPTHFGSLTKVPFFHLRGSASDVSKT